MVGRCREAHQQRGPRRARRGGGRRSVRRPLHPARRADGRTRHRSARHPRPGHRRTQRAARAGRPAARGPVGPAGRGPRPRRYRGPGSETRRCAGDHAGRSDQPHRDHRPPARHPVRGGGGRTRRGRRRHQGARRRHPRHGHRVTRPGSGRRCSGRRPARGRTRRAVGRAGRDRRRARRVDPRQRAGRRSRPHRPRNSRRGRRPVPHRTVLPQPRHRTQRRRAGPDLRRRAGGLLRTQGRDQDAGRRLGQAPEVRRAPQRHQRPIRRSAYAASGSPRETPGCWSGNWTPSPPRPSAPATRRG